MVITPSRPEMQTQPWPQLCAILSKSSYFVTNANPFANKLIKDSMFASRGDSWSSPVTAGEERSGSELTKTIKYSNRHLARIKTDFLDRLEAKKESSPARERYNRSQGLGVTRQLFSVVLQDSYTSATQAQHQSVLTQWKWVTGNMCLSCVS